MKEEKKNRKTNKPFKSEVKKNTNKIISHSWFLKERKRREWNNVCD